MNQKSIKLSKLQYGGFSHCLVVKLYLFWILNWMTKQKVLTIHEWWGRFLSENRSFMTWDKITLDLRSRKLPVVIGAPGKLTIKWAWFLEIPSILVSLRVTEHVSKLCSSRWKHHSEWLRSCTACQKWWYEDAQWISLLIKELVLTERPPNLILYDDLHDFVLQVSSFDSKTNQ